MWQSSSGCQNYNLEVKRFWGFFHVHELSQKIQIIRQKVRFSPDNIRAGSVNRNHDTYRGKILQSYNGAFSVGFLVASF